MMIYYILNYSARIIYKLFRIYTGMNFNRDGLIEKLLICYSHRVNIINKRLNHCKENFKFINDQILLKNISSKSHLMELN